ncbi:hypothetical protein ACPA54_31000 [Uniformispora flossi]|uniref:hypothetical protein n=1 Tax=Uniformispora flossi TaxID=3390723 RepID=UPI003C2FFA33
MALVAVVYVPQKSKGNFEIGCRRSIWGWRDSALDKAGARAELRKLRTGDLLLLGYGGPQPRVSAGGWAGAALATTVLAQVTRPPYRDTTPVWPNRDEVFPERLDFRILTTEDRVTWAPQAMEAFRMSANKQGVAVLLPEDEFATDADRYDAVAADTYMDDEAPPERILDVEGRLSRLVQAVVRCEQPKLREWHFPRGKSEGDCALCGRRLPKRMLHVAHVKKRSQCDAGELVDTVNTMKACVLGCDALFEYGYVRVDTEGYIHAYSDGPSATNDLAAAARALDGRRCTAHSEISAAYFAWHSASFEQQARHSARETNR